jgi:NTP pyrophosphatase (non-canonical NTP hydrolase)
MKVQRRINAQSLKLRKADDRSLRFINDTEEGHDILVLRLADEFGEDADVWASTLPFWRPNMLCVA